MLLRRRFRAAGGVVRALNYPFGSDVFHEASNPFVKRRNHRGLASQAVGLGISIGFSNSDVGARPEAVRDFDAAIAALPNEALISLALILERLVFWIKLPLVRQNLRSPSRIQIGRPTIAIAEKSRGPVLEVIPAQFFPLG